MAALAFVLVSGCSDMQAMELRARTLLLAPEGPPENAVIVQPLAPTRRDVFTRSYRLGETYTAHVGEPVVSVKNYSITERVGRATVLRDFGQTCRHHWPARGAPTLCEDTPLDSLRGAQGSVFDVVGAVTGKDGQFFAVAIPSDGHSQVYLLVDPTGRLRRGAYVVWREDRSAGSTIGRVPFEDLAPDIAMDQETPLFSFESVEKFIYMGPGYLSFDVVFTGTRSSSRGEFVTFSYREFGRDSTDRPVFEKPLQFPIDEPVIDVPPLRLEVEPVGYNEVHFRVIADGQPAPTR